MQRSDHGLELIRPSADAVVHRALAAANMSYAPYTGQPAGAALLAPDGRIVAGAYAESAAYNPSLPPLQAALAQMQISADELAIVRAVLVQTDASASTIDHTGPARAVLASVAPGIQLECHTARSGRGNPA